MAWTAESRRAWRLKNKEKCRQYAKRWYAKNKSRHKESCRRWRLENHDRYLEINRKWYRSESGQAYLERTRKKRKKQWLRRWAMNPEKYILATRRWIRTPAGRARMTEWRKKNREKVRESNRRWGERNKERTRAHARVYQALQSGRLVKLPCSECGTTKDVGATHNSYGPHLDITWLCRDCRMARTRRMPTMKERALALARSI